MTEDVYSAAWMKLVTTPKGEKVFRSYDWISPFSKGRYRLTRCDGKFGILKLFEKSTVEILEPVAIRPPRLENLFLYDITSAKLENEAILIDSTGRILQTGIGIWVIDESLASVEKQDNRFFLYNPLNDHCSTEFSDFEVFEAYIETHEGELKGLLTRDFVEIFKPEFQSVEAFGSCFIATRADETKVLGHPNWGKTVEAEEIFSERNGFICLHSKTRYAFIEVETGRRTQFIFPYAESYSHKGYVKVEHPLLGLCWMDKDFNFLPARDEE